MSAKTARNQRRVAAGAYSASLLESMGYPSWAAARAAAARLSAETRAATDAAGAAARRGTWQLALREGGTLRYTSGTPGLVCTLRRWQERGYRCCRHLRQPQPVFLAAWDAVLRCGGCFTGAMAPITGTLEDRTCDLCRTVEETIATRSVPIGPITVAYGLCARCAEEERPYQIPQGEVPEAVRHHLAGEPVA